MTQGSFWPRLLRPSNAIRSRFTGGKGGRTLNRFRRIAQLAHSPYSGWRLLCFAYCRFAQSEFLSTSARPIGKRINPPGPGNQPISGARIISPQPRMIIAHWKERFSESLRGLGGGIFADVVCVPNNRKTGRTKSGIQRQRISRAARPVCEPYSCSVRFARSCPEF
jgi:hypothetical protein